MRKARKLAPDYSVKKLLRKQQLSASLDKDAVRLLTYMAQRDRRSVSAQLNMIIYSAAVASGLKLGASLPPLPPEMPPEEHHEQIA